MKRKENTVQSFNPTTKYSSSKNLVLQILPELERKINIEMGKVAVNGNYAKRIATIVFIPQANTNNTIWCPLNYFQTSVSLRSKWILNDNGKKITLNGVDELEKVVITKKVGENEEVIELSDKFCSKILNYFMLDMNQGKVNLKGFDCYAFVSLIADVKYFPSNPDFNYKKTRPKIGDFVVLSTNINLPDSIKHWALCIGENLYISKIGRSGEGTQSLVSIMDQQSMQNLYGCKFIYVAIPKNKASTWSWYKK